MRALVDQPELLAIHGVSPDNVRRRAWIIGTVFAALSGICLAQTVGLSALVLTLLVVQAFGAAAVGFFRSIPLTYLGGLIVGVVAAVSTKYVTQVPALGGFPPSVPFIVLFIVLVMAPSRRLVEFVVERKPPVREPRHYGRNVRFGGAAVAAVGLVALPYAVGTRLPVYTTALAYVLMFLSLALLMRTSGQVSLAQLAFAAVGAAAASRLTAEAGVPWLLAVPAGALMAVPVGALLAIPAIRRSGLYLALATFGFAVLLERLVFYSSLMFGSLSSSLPAPRPSFAQGDRAYFYVVLVFVIAAIAFVAGIHRSRLGRLLRAMADSPTALTTSGTSVTAIKVIVFCIAAFLAGLGGALLGPVTGRASPGNFEAFLSLQLVVLSVVVGGGEIVSSIVAALAFAVLPSYITNSRLNDYLPVLFGVSAVLVSVRLDGVRAPAWLARTAGRRRSNSCVSLMRARVPSLSRVDASATPQPGEAA